MAILEIREPYQAPKKLGKTTLIQKHRHAETGKLVDVIGEDGKPVPVTETLHRWTPLGILSELRTNEHLYLVEPLEDSAAGGHAMRVLLRKLWPDVNRNDISGTDSFTLARSSVEHCPDLRMAED